MSTTLAVLISILSPAVAIVGLVVASARARLKLDQTITKQIANGDKVLAERLHDQEVLCAGVRGEVLTKLESLEKSQDHQTEKLDKILGWIRTNERG